MTIKRRFFFVFFCQVGFIPCKFEQKLQGMESKEKEKEDKSIKDGEHKR